MAGKVVTYEDFSGGHYTGGNDAKQPMNTWRGTDIDISPATGYLLRRDENLYPTGRFTKAQQYRNAQSAADTWTFSSFSAPTLSEDESFSHSAPIVADGSKTGGVSEPAVGNGLWILWWQQGGTLAAPTGYFMRWYFYNGYTADSINGPIKNNGGSSATSYARRATSNMVAWRDTSNGLLRAAIAVCDASLVTAELMMFESRYPSVVAVAVTSGSGPIKQAIIWNDWLVLLRGAGVLFNLNNTSSPTFPYTYQVGALDDILSITADKDRILIGKRDGWYTFTGDPADVDTVTIRKISEAVGPSPAEGWKSKNRRSPVVITPDGALYPPVAGENTGHIFYEIMAYQEASLEVRRLAGLSSRIELKTQYTANVNYMTGIEQVTDSAIAMVATDGTPETPGLYPYSPDERGHWIRKQDGRWFHWSTDGLPSNAVVCTDYRLGDRSPRESLIFLGMPTPSGSQLTNSLSALNLYTDYPTSWKPARVELAPYAQARPFIVKAVIVTYDIGRLIQTDDTSPFGVGTVKVSASMASLAHEGVSTDESPLHEAFASEAISPATSDERYRRKVNMVRFSPTGLSAGNELTLSIDLGGVRLRRVNVIIDEQDWPT